MEIEIARVDWPFRSVFRNAYEVRTHSETVRVELREGSARGRGEALGVSYQGETADALLAQLADVKEHLSRGVSRAQLQTLMPAGGARNAVDCALWDLEARQSGRRAWELAGLPSVRPLSTAYTLSMDTPEAMARVAAGLAGNQILKVKLSGQGDIERVAAVREARPDAEIIVDANQSWGETQLASLTAKLMSLRISLIEQPLPVGKDEALSQFRSPVPLCADESCQTAASLPALVGKYEFVSIKLDKTGGLTEALNLISRAREYGFRLMVGCMGGSSLSMAPAFIVGQYCAFVDLDSPLLSSEDVPHGIRYAGTTMYAPEPALWG